MTTAESNLHDLYMLHQLQTGSLGILEQTNGIWHVLAIDLIHMHFSTCIIPHQASCKN